MPLIIPSNSISGEFEVANSLRFAIGSSDYLNRTPSSAGNRKTFTWSFWVKRSDLASSRSLYSVDTASGTTGFSASYFTSTGELFIGVRESSGEKRLKTNQVVRDVSAWYHIVIAFDTTQSTGTDRIKLYVNGSQVTSFAEQNDITQNFDTSVNNTVTQDIGVYKNSGGSRNSNFDGYMAEVCLIDGQQLDPTSFGEFDEDTGIWKPIDVSGLTFGTNGFYLDFENSGSLGNDKSGNGNNFTVNNLTSDDQVIDTPTNNFATLNPLDNYWSNGTLSNGNLTFLSDTSNVTYIPSTLGVSSGKWYWEVEFDAKSGGSDSPVIGITSTQPTAGNQQLGNFPNDWGYFGYSPSSYINNNTETSYGSSYTTNDIIGVALDLDNNKLYFSKNGTWQNSGDPTSGATGTGALSITDPSSTPLGFYFPAICYYNVSNTGTFNANFGSSAFSYSVPSGYYALNTKNLAEYG